MIYAMQTGEEWECYRSHIGILQKYTFSPDSRYIAVSDGYPGLGGGIVEYLYVVDIQTCDKTRLFKGGGSPFAWR
jgi:hypothetical protein